MNQLPHFGQHKTTLVVTRHVSWAHNITKIALRPGLCPGPRMESLPYGCFPELREKGKEGTMRKDCSVRNFWLRKLATLNRSVPQRPAELQDG